MAELLRTYLAPQELNQLWNGHKVASAKGAPPKVVLYDEIIKSRSIESLFGNSNKLIVFYPMMQQGGQTSGHYISLVRNSEKNTIYFYDSYGSLPDVGQKRHANRKLYDEENNSLIKLLLNSGYNVDYSPYHHQKEGDIATCGRHSLMRALYDDLSNDEYNQVVKEASKKLGITPDMLSVLVFH